MASLKNATFAGMNSKKKARAGEIRLIFWIFAPSDRRGCARLRSYGGGEDGPDRTTIGLMLGGRESPEVVLKQYFEQLHSLQRQR